MRKIAIFVVLALTVGSITVTAQKQNKKSMKKVLFVVTSHDKLGNTGEKLVFGQKN